MATPEQLRANRANAKLSSGPKSRDGKKASSRNSLKHGQTSRMTVLPDEDQDAFEALRARFVEEHAPRDGLELFMVEQMAHHAWCLTRARGFEAQLDAYDRITWEIACIELREQEDLEYMMGLNEPDAEASDDMKRKGELMRQKNALVGRTPFMRGETDNVRDRLARHEESHLKAFLKLVNQFRRMRMSPVPALPGPAPEKGRTDQ